MKLKNITRVILIFAIIISIFGMNAVNANSILEQAKNWLATGEAQRANSAINQSSNQGFEELAGMLWGAGIFVILIIGVILGIRYIMSTPEQKAQLNKALITYLIGAVIIIGASVIWKLSIEIFEDMAH